MTATRTNIEFAKRIFTDRVGNDYVYGGNWDPLNVKVGTDCSGLVIDELDAAVNGTAMAWSRHGMSTESWRPIDVGEIGTIFNTICVASPNDFPADAAVKIAIHHGPGGGANSHMWCEVDGIRMESNGSDGCVTGNRARSVCDTNYANDWHYLPGPIVDRDIGPGGVRVLSLAMAPTVVGLDQLAAYLPHFAEAMRAAEITTVPRAAAWCGQIGHESLGLRYMAEIQTSGPDWNWDRTRYRGRGPIQLTWQSNYRKFGQWCKAKGYVTDSELFVNQPELVEQPKWGFLAASWYWLNGGPRPGQINGFADAGDILAVSRCVNGWVDTPNGMPDRTSRYNRCLSLGDQLLSLLTPTTPIDPIEELLMSDLAVPSLSIYADPGEPDVPIVDMIRALDAHGPHEPYVENQARLGEPDAIRRVARTAAGQGKYGTAAGPVNQAKSILNEIKQSNPAVLQQFLAQNGARS
ncbi:Bacteriophage protein [Mycobacteroides abscessus subsp. massiliense]|uniref:glycoside hydrolase family 19 protein n=1 Tax=Mycobacteroides abscessus TaxID=36809 RepID=UPI0009A6809D|nr:glycoside hydrolase family 19 protein [Mycobacteroides abscessus]SKD34348.1 Bacteriophage protein [Mycobacteroides abscessus subsp. massiliense]SKD34733.1 Bacteriophage protein [Mycobacteroides abscessus subsp. massiliense]SKD48846.1 Bacteriophage protein [Mycobacteroides abscessus subsp. massiliense]SKD51596.1 Bacteriophage protein [Mycobacteroides abscessus subsp. massiliense]SKD60875.1 Bacteriophage protein [Mycobacteroides abscessus subsp. massiliense]